MVLSMPGGVRIQEARPSYGRRGGRPPRRHSQSWVGAAVREGIPLPTVTIVSEKKTREGWFYAHAYHQELDESGNVRPAKLLV